MVTTIRARVRRISREQSQSGQLILIGMKREKLEEWGRQGRAGQHTDARTQHNKNTEGLDLGSSQYLLLLAEASAGVGDGAGTAMELVGVV
jgi:hypothetical protein